MTDDDRGDFIETYTGRKFYPLSPKREDVSIEDIAHALSMKCRYSGHSNRFYSVAEHSVMVSRMVPDPHKLHGLLHDAAEAYLPDICRPIKPDISGFRDIEARVMHAICSALHVEDIWPEDVKSADLRALTIESDALMRTRGRQWSTFDASALGRATVHAWQPSKAKYEFLAQYARLRGVYLDSRMFPARKEHR